MDTEDRDRFLIAWLWHCPKAQDRAWSLKHAFATMNRRLTVVPTGNSTPWTGASLSDAEAIAIIDEASDLGPIWHPDKLGRYLGLTTKQRTLLRIKSIGARDSSRRARRARRRILKRDYQRLRRQGAGARPHSQSLSATEPWRKMGMSRRTWYRQNRHRMARGTDSWTITLESLGYEPVPVERVKEEFERGFASKEARGLPSSRTVVHVAADVPVSVVPCWVFGRRPIPENLARENHEAA